eukprot:944953-Heterocapsa_arctica.AAC.1
MPAAPGAAFLPGRLILPAILPSAFSSFLAERTDFEEGIPFLPEFSSGPSLGAPIARALLGHRDPSASVAAAALFVQLLTCHSHAGS